ncbi:MAG: YggS family pyridoxal phosphate-dependent enzyme [Sulfurospirillaceae bacterium]|nr:YggS family pyridoxal phosphate-dependent enzyme [Sulfurospirillaceae bacterium]
MSVNIYEKRLDAVFEKIEKARTKVSEHQIIKLVAVSKSVTSKEVELLYNAGQRAFGENRVQELTKKCEELENLPLEWHFIGRLQKNKINALLDQNVSLIHSCESFSLAKEIDKRLEAKGKKVNILLQINSAKEDSKSGVMPEVANEEYLKILSECKNINLLGVMSMGAHEDDVKLVQKSFEATYKIFESLKSHGASICSMGMSGDYELAISCGSNMVRLGSTIFH